MPDADPWTIGRLLTWTTDYLKRNGSEGPRLEAEVLLAAARGCERIQLYTAFADEVSDEVRTRFRDYVQRRAAGEPVAYIVGHREFYSLSVRVQPGVLIPRPETEHLVVEVLDRIKERGSRPLPARIADIGTGSGAIAIAVAKHAPEVRLVAIDRSPQALEVARGNFQEHGVADRIEVIPSDLLTELPAEMTFDIVASNPPYVSEPEWAHLPATVKNFEPREALVGGPTGVETIARLVPQASQRLLPAGWLILEISPQIERAVRSCIAADGGYEEAITRKDLSGLARVVSARKREIDA
jgi:release factor glutamine methyltransferase